MPESIAISTSRLPDESAGFGLMTSAAAADRRPAPEIVLELQVRNHPGAMSHITGLFARRGFNLDAIICVPTGDGAVSRMLLLVGDEPRLEQVERQLAKLHDVLALKHRPDLGADALQRCATV